jgi:Arc/MetJ-type ribon-helix-helix transcriptional regulator
MTQRPIAVRLPDETLSGLDRLVAEGWYVTRSEGIKDALEKLLEAAERQRIDRALIEGYERMPETAEELDWAEWNARELFKAWADDQEDW